MFDAEHPPELAVSSWLNSKPLTLAGLKGKVVVVVAFQMVCSGSVKHALPQAARITRSFQRDTVEVIGLHMPIEAPGEMTQGKLAAFVKKQGLTFPIAFDKLGKDNPVTMTAYEMRGSPTILLFDRQGRLRRHYLGQVDDFRLGAEIMALSIESPEAPREASLAIERWLHAALTDPADHDHHGHDHGDPGHGHSGHVHTDACDHDHGQAGHVHTDACNHGHDHAHGHAHGAHAPDHDARKAVAAAVKAQLRAKK